jgi:hypothetical protein
MLAMQEACERPLMYLTLFFPPKRSWKVSLTTHAYKPCSLFVLSNVCRWLYEPCSLTKMVRGDGSSKQQR